MRTVKTKKELIKAIEDGEKHIKVDSLPLYTACKLAETCNDTVDVMKRLFSRIMIDRGEQKVNYDPKTGTSTAISNAVAIAPEVAITITIAIAITTISIIAIIRDKKVIIKCKGYGLDGEVDFG